ncbi:GntR family transcriptional regulator [Streptomyces sp. NPDC101151]|uniref:GntR family transcriptional regulator n=1 Tax=Streptomyces sp. NPDC101151 TaxID=3366115 RepID=UPI003811BD49
MTQRRVPAAPQGPAGRKHAAVTVQQATLAWLRDRIAAGEFRPGDQLRQEHLAQAFGVSVPPVREALKTLEAEGHLVYAPHRGYFVAALSFDELAENYRIRELLETEAIRRAVPVLDEEDISRMRDAVADMERAHDDTDILDLTGANRRFHFALFDAAGMPRMADIIRMLWEATDRYRSLYFATHEHRCRVNDEHRDILAAVSAQDTETAVRLLDHHRDHALQALRTALPGTDAGAPDA